MVGAPKQSKEAKENPEPLENVGKFKETCCRKEHGRTICKFI